MSSKKHKAKLFSTASAAGRCVDKWRRELKQRRLRLQPWRQQNHRIYLAL
jgi:hypothetical protein